MKRIYQNKAEWYKARGVWPQYMIKAAAADTIIKFARWTRCMHVFVYTLDATVCVGLCMWSRQSSKGIKHITSVSFGSFAHFVEATKHWQIFVLVVYGCPAKSVLFIHLFCIDIAINFADSSGVEWILFMCASVYSCPFYSIQMW